MALDIELLSPIARGAQGALFLVRAGGAPRPLALKVIDVREADAPRILSELRGLATGDPDPAILEFLAVGEESELPDPAREALGAPPAGRRRLFLLMPHVDGPNVRELCRRDSAFGPAEVAALVLQVAQRLRRLPPGRAHLDLKPENVLVDRGGRAFLVDAQLLTQAGTAGYAAPEQRAGGAPGPAADVYALGRMGLFLLARDLPGGGDASGDEAPLPRLPDWPIALPPSVRRGATLLVALLREMAQREAAARPTIAPALERLVEIAALVGATDAAGLLAKAVGRAGWEGLASPLSALPPPPPGGGGGFAGPPRGRRRFAWLAIGGLIAFGAAGFGSVFWGARPPWRWSGAAAPAAAAAATGPALDGKGRRIAFPIGVEDPPPKGYGSLTLAVALPASRLEVTSMRSEQPFWFVDEPKLGQRFRVALLPDDQYLLIQSYPGGSHWKEWPFTVPEPGSPRPQPSFHTVRYTEAAPQRSDSPLLLTTPDELDPNGPWGPLPDAGAAAPEAGRARSP